MANPCAVAQRCSAAPEDARSTKGVYGPSGKLAQGPRPVAKKQEGKRVLTLPPGHRMTIAIEVVASEAGSTSSVVMINTRRKDMSGTAGGGGLFW